MQSYYNFTGVFMYRILLFMITVFLITGCTSDKKLASKVQSDILVIENGTRKLNFEKLPQRLVTLRQHITETALEMNLDKYIIGASAVIDPPVAEHLEHRYGRLPIIAEKYPSPETLLAADPDIIWVDRKWAFVKNQLGAMENLERYGIKIYLSESGFHESSRIEYVYEDIRKMGEIFSAGDRADIVIKRMQEKILTVQSHVKNTETKVKVLDFDSGRNNLAFVGCKCMADDLIKLAGGINIFQDVDKEWANVSWEEIMRRNPDVIIVHEYRGVSGRSKIAALKKNPVLQEVTAIKNNRFIIVNLDEIYEGVRNAETVEKFAKGFYPEKFI